MKFHHKLPMQIGSLFCLMAGLAVLLCGTGCQTDKSNNATGQHYLYVTQLGTNCFPDTPFPSIDAALDTLKPKTRFEINENPTIIAYNLNLGSFAEIRVRNVQTHEAVSRANITNCQDALTIVSLYVSKPGEYELYIPDWFGSHSAFRFSVARPKPSGQPREDSVSDHSIYLGSQRELQTAPKDAWQNYDVLQAVLIEQKWYELLDQRHFEYLPGKVILTFQEFLDGTVHEVKTAESDLSRPQTESCIDALNKTAPLPSWPETLQRKSPRDYRDMTYTFYCL